MLAMVMNDARLHVNCNVALRIVNSQQGDRPGQEKPMFDKVNMRPWATRQHYINVHAYQTHRKILHQQKLRLGYFAPISNLKAQSSQRKPSTLLLLGMPHAHYVFLL